MRYFPLLAGLTALIATSAPAAARDYCPDRPGIDTPPCTVEPGKLSVEMSGLDWTRESSPTDRTDTLLIGDLALRYGIADHAELRFAWTPFGHSHFHDRLTGTNSMMSGTGDVTLGIKRNLVDPDGQKVSIALLPSVSLPTGGQAIGAGDWGAGLQIPASVPLGAGVSLAVTPEFDAAVDADRHGRHFAYGSAAGFSIAPVQGLAIALEAAVSRDEDPSGHSTSSIAGAAAGLMLGDNLQIDAGTEIGLNHATPGLHVYFGVSRRF